MPPAKDPREKHVRDLHEVFQAGNLRILVGAGASIASGFPNWEELNRRLLIEQLIHDVRADEDWQKPLGSLIGELAEQLYDALGREGAAEYVEAARRSEAGQPAGPLPESFRDLLAQVLYEGKRVQSLAVRSLHFQITAMAGRARIVTTNYDPLLELALAERLLKEGTVPKAGPDLWRKVRWPPGKAARNPEGAPKIEHIHGWIDPDGATDGGLVLTESQYLELARSANQDATANRVLEEILGQAGATVVVGMSLSDPNLRRVLYLLNRNPNLQRADSSTYIILLSQGHLVDRYVAMHWGRRNVFPITVRRYDEIPGLLRDIQWGLAEPGEPPQWVETALAILDANLGKDAFFTDKWQALAFESLKRLKEQMTTLFGVRPDEQIRLSLFAPVRLDGGVVLSLVAHSSVLRPGAYRRAKISERSLHIGRGQEQGLAGQVFTAGFDGDGLASETTVDQGFSETMKRDWVSPVGYRDWRAILGRPHLHRIQRLPLAVLTVTSNLADPFWRRFGNEDHCLRAELNEAIDAAVQYVLDLSAGASG